MKYKKVACNNQAIKTNNYNATMHPSIKKNFLSAKLVVQQPQQLKQIDVADSNLNYLGTCTVLQTVMHMQHAGNKSEEEL